MEQLVVSIALLFLGLCLGSFAGATVWRLRARQLIEDKAEGEKVDSKEYKKLLPLTQTTTTTDRSRCLHCGHTLAWYDLLPLVSWMSTKGKCRYCQTSIGWFEPTIELGTALFFVGSYLLWPYALVNTIETTIFALWLVAGVLLAILFAYDLKWSLLPNRAMFPLVGVSALIAVLHLINAPNVFESLVSLVVAGVILSGLYLALWYVSKGRWIGYGDIKLGLALALLLGDWPLAFIALFAANFIGCLIVIPGLLSGKMTRQTHVPFGPLLIAGGVIAMLFGQAIIQWYMNILI
jgi:leader peptidase (prepilin peptidase)/N-methyltransferase